MDNKKISRCAIYTRKSHENGLEQEFNSLTAQRESAENYIASQKANGWQALPQKYDDGGFTGGNMERPALKRLLADIEAGMIDIIVVYKMDRLSRSLLDFMKLAEMLDQHNVSFVSVTQDINTSTSAGRMMLNILMTFGQYEMEILAERIKDKIAGAKRRGKYCGGTPPLGYEPDNNKKLVINETEAELVRYIFQRYSELGSARQVTRELNEKGFKTKTWTTKKGRTHEGVDFDTGHVYRMLGNPIYAGNVSHKDKIFKGEHEAIISEKLWKKVQAILEANTYSDERKKPTFNPLKGFVRCGHCGGGMTSTFSKKGKKRYSYFLCVKDSKRGESSCPLKRVSCGDIERAVLQQLVAVFRTPEILMRTFEEACENEKQEKIELAKKKQELLGKLKDVRREIQENIGDGEKMSRLKEDCGQLNRELSETTNALSEISSAPLTQRDIAGAFSSVHELWDELFPGEKYRLLRLLVKNVTLKTDSMEMVLKTSGFASLIDDLTMGGNEADFSTGTIGREKKFNTEVKISLLEDGNIRITAPLIVKHKRGRKFVIVPGAIDGEIPDAESPVQGSLALMAARGNVWMRMIEEGKVKDIHELAVKTGYHRTHVWRILQVANLSPGITESILCGTEPDGLSMTLLKRPLPEDWLEQKEMFKFA
ncbi:MAG: hypothetical protein A2017_20450 [Lentisphaerae bacterium GWF2_44_16]|nr:MAG: hypothetical protein A2017_20450 [Lentisphaerae bacterium GWF2_44_16]